MGWKSMNVYQIGQDISVYKELQLGSIELAEQLGLDIDSDEFMEYLDLGSNGLSFKDRWGDVEAVFEASPACPEAIEIPNISILNRSTLVFSEKAHAFFQLCISEFGEFLPISVKGFRFYIFNILARSKVDESKCKYTYQEGVVRNVERLVFDEDDVPKNALFFDAHQGFGGIYCNDDFKNSYEEFEMDGLTFTKI